MVEARSNAICIDISVSALKLADASLYRAYPEDFHQALVDVDGPVPFYMQELNHASLPLTSFHDGVCWSWPRRRYLQ